MKKSILALGLAFAALTLPSCSQNEELDVTPVVTPSFELYANIDTRTVNDGVKTNWVAGDQINVFHAEAGATEVEYVNDNAFETEEADGLFKGSLAGELTAEAYDWFALYPYSSYVKTPANTNSGYITVGAKVQTQNGNNSMAHLAGDNCPLVGVATGVAAGVKPEFTMNHITAVAKFVVKNTLSEAITVNNIYFTAPDGQLITGTYYVNFVEYPSVVYTGSGSNYTSNVATLNVTDGTAIAAGESAEFYLAMVPFTLEVGDALNIKVSAKVGEETIVDEADVELEDNLDLKAGHIKVFNVNFDTELAPEVALELPFSETFETNQGDFTIDNVNIGTLSYVWNYDSYKYMKASAYLNSKTYAAESWLVSPLIAISAETNGAPILTFDNAINKGTAATALTLKVLADGEWSDVAIPNRGTGTSWTWVSSGDIDLSAYKGKNIKFAFVYKSTESEAATVEIKNVKLEAKKFSQTISFAEAAFTLNVGDTFEGQQVTGAKTTVTYASDNTDVAAVNAQTGVVTLGTTPGTAVITATAAEDATYDSATAVYTITLNEAGVEIATATLSFANTANRTSYSTTQQIWEQNGITVTNNKNTSSTNVGDYSNPARFYKSSDLIVKSSIGNIVSIEFVCTTEEYAEALTNSVTTGTASYSGTTATVILDPATDTFKIDKFSAKVFVSEITITYISNGSVAQKNQTLSFDQQSYTAEVGDEFTAPTLKGAQTTVTYKSSNTDVATVDETTGAVTIVAAGTTTITATAAETDEYYGATASYTLEVTAPATGGDDTTNAYTLLTDVSQLTAGSSIVIAAKGYNYAISTTQNSNNRAQAAVKKSGNTITFGDDVQILTVEAGSTAGSFAFNTGSGYLFAASSSKNYLKTETSLSANSSWSVDIAADGTATIKAKGGNTRNWLRYNSTNNPPIFSCYGSGQADVVIYILK